MKNLLFGLLLLLSLSLLPHNSHAQINTIPACSNMAPGTVCGNASGSTATPVAVPLGTGLSYVSGALTAGGSAINLQVLGACGITDGTTIFNAAAATAATTGQAIYIPGGCTLNHSGTLTLNGIQLIGDGINSILNATDTSTTPHLSLFLQGSGVVVRGINFKTNWTGARCTQIYCSAVDSYTTALSNFSIDHNFFTSAFAGSDIQLQYSVTNGDISYNQLIVGAKANPIILQSGVGIPDSNINIHDNIVSGLSGDNCIELVSYGTTPGTYMNVVGNQLENCGAAGVAVLGQQNVNVVANNIVNSGGRGIDIESIGSNTSASSINVTVVGNNITGSANNYIFVLGRTGFFASDITIADNTLNITTGFRGIFIQGCDTCTSAPITTRINAHGNVIVGDGVNAITGIWVRGAQDVTLDDNSITGMLDAAIQIVASGNAGQLMINNNLMSNLNLRAAGTSSAIILSNSPGFSSMKVVGNSYTQGAVAVSHFLACAGTPVPVVNLNIGTDTSVSGCTPIAGLPNTTVTPGSYGDGAHVGTFTVGADGRLTAASSVSVSGGGSSSTVLLYQWGVPVILSSSGTISTTPSAAGGFVPTVALPSSAVCSATVGCYMYFTAGALDTSSVAGSYYTQCASVSSCSVFNNALGTSAPAVIGSPTSFGTTVPGNSGTYTQTTASVGLVTLSIPGGTMGANGALVIDVTSGRVNNSGGILEKINYGNTTIGQLQVATTAWYGLHRIFRNLGSQSSNVYLATTSGTAASDVAATSVAPTYSTIATQTTGNLSVNAQLVTASTDWFIVFGGSIVVTPAP